MGEKKIPILTDSVNLFGFSISWVINFIVHEGQ